MSKICGKKSCGVSVGMGWVGMSWGWVRLGECEGEGRWVESGGWGGMGWGAGGAFGGATAAARMLQGLRRLQDTRKLAQQAGKHSPGGARQERACLEQLEKLRLVGRQRLAGQQLEQVAKIVAAVKGDPPHLRQEAAGSHPLEIGDIAGRMAKQAGCLSLRSKAWARSAARQPRPTH